MKDESTDKQSEAVAAEAQSDSVLSNSKFRPLGSRIFILPAELDEKTVGGIYIPETAREKPKRGKVEAVGRDAKRVAVGDTVLYERYAGNKLVVDRVEYLVVKEEEIMGIYE